MSDDEASPDIIIPTGVTEDGSVRVLRVDEDGGRLGIVRPFKDGRPLQEDSEIIDLTPCSEGHYHVKTLHKAADRKGPSTAATKEYRDNWETIFGEKEKPN